MSNSDSEFKNLFGDHHDGVPDSMWTERVIRDERTRDVHFCEDPRVALCGQAMPDFPQRTSNAFAGVTCPGCRVRVRATRLAPGGFADPPEWTSP